MTEATRLLLLGTQGMSQPEITRALGRSPAAVKDALRRLRTVGVVRIGAWRRKQTQGGRHTPVYVLGSGPDCPPPAPLAKRDVQRRYLQRRAQLFTPTERATLGVWAGLV